MVSPKNSVEVQLKRKAKQTATTFQRSPPFFSPLHNAADILHIQFFFLSSYAAANC